MDVRGFITSIPYWALFSLFVIVGVLTTELGSYFGQRKFQKGNKELTAPIGTAVSATLGLLAFMLGFTFSLTAARFSDRKGLAIEQANAIGTCYLRAGLAPETQKNEVRRLLKDYTSLLLQVQSTNDVESKLNRLEDIHKLLWDQALALEEKNMLPALQSLFIASINEVINLDNERETVALVYRIPNVLWTALLLLTGMSMFAFGYQTGINGNRRISGFPLLPVAYGLVIVLIADMDSTNLRRFQVSNKPLKNLQKMMERNP